eukprot:gnl/MRDRNA2_/MRDRNA2_115399_c0_seq1.p1 gnl/MRDRNA2_/MRDRNA2_115399_c0~~gnl/MRDRNA2_/MRDRNA2_115399_c0_seq1.p1  ORF type:complete len:303 (-),score=58.53 gnl/MRDRNA2_/MRDRNA2_115399_c0_seq1:40-948(-)
MCTFISIMSFLFSVIAQLDAQVLFVREMADDLLGRAHREQLFHCDNLDSTTLAKRTGQLAMGTLKPLHASTSHLSHHAPYAHPAFYSSSLKSRSLKLPVTCLAANGGGKEGSTDGNLVSRSLFALTEMFAQLGNRPKPEQTTPRSDIEALSVDDAAQLVKDEHEAAFWTTGSMNFDLWETGCIFADPFSSFGGDDSVARFQKNAAGLAGFLQEGSNLRMTSFDVEKFDTPRSIDAVHPAQAVVRVGWSFSGKLKLPWRPVLAAAGSTAHYLSAYSGRIVRYEESWISKPGDVVRRLFVPTKN